MVDGSVYSGIDKKALRSRVRAAEKLRHEWLLAELRDTYEAWCAEEVEAIDLIEACGRFLEQM